MPPKARFTRERQERFLEALRLTGNVTEAAREVGISRSRAYQVRAADEAFALRWRDACLSLGDRIEAEAVRRALEGVEEPYFYQGEERGTVRRYNDALLMFLLKMRRPDIFEQPDADGPAGTPEPDSAGPGRVVFELHLGGGPGGPGPEADDSDGTDHTDHGNHGIHGEGG
ncbi:MAG: hypothetical protein AB7D51_12750 [Desulfovibrionaceae bacterium]